MHSLYAAYTVYFCGFVDNVDNIKKLSTKKGTYLCAILLCAYPVLQPNALGYLGIETDVWDQSKSY